MLRMYSHPQYASMAKILVYTPVYLHSTGMHSSTPQIPRHLAKRSKSLQQYPQQRLAAEQCSTEMEEKNEERHCDKIQNVVRINPECRDCVQPWKQLAAYNADKLPSRSCSATLRISCLPERCSLSSCVSCKRRNLVSVLDLSSEVSE